MYCTTGNPEYMHVNICIHTCTHVHVYVCVLQFLTFWNVTFPICRMADSTVNILEVRVQERAVTVSTTVVHVVLPKKDREYILSIICSTRAYMWFPHTCTSTPCMYMYMYEGCSAQATYNVHTCTYMYMYYNRMLYQADSCCVLHCTCTCTLYAWKADGRGFESHPR